MQCRTVGLSLYQAVRQQLPLLQTICLIGSPLGLLANIRSAFFITSSPGAPGSDPGLYKRDHVRKYRYDEIQYKSMAPLNGIWPAIFPSPFSNFFLLISMGFPCLISRQCKNIIKNPTQLQNSSPIKFKMSVK